MAGRKLESCCEVLDGNVRRSAFVDDPVYMADDLLLALAEEIGDVLLRDFREAAKCFGGDKGSGSVQDSACGPLFRFRDPLRLKAQADDFKGDVFYRPGEQCGIAAGVPSNAPRA